MDAFARPRAQRSRRLQRRKWQLGPGARLTVSRSGLPPVAVFTLGGTISSTVNRSAGATPRLTASGLLSAVPSLRRIARIQAVNFRKVASSELRVDDVIRLSTAIRRKIASGAVGSVVTQGTDSLEETAFALDLLLEGDAPVIVTGAMRNPSSLSHDGPANLVAAVRVAISATARGLGTLVVLNDEIHAARFVQKTHTLSLAAFRSRPTGPLGWIVEGQARIAVRPSGRHHVGIRPDSTVAAVALIKWGQGDDGRLLDQVDRIGFSGAVVEALGGGHIPSVAVSRISRLASAIPVVVVSRTGSGELLRSTYGFAGSERDILSRGVISGGMLDGPKARVLLTLLISAGAGREAIAEAFDVVGTPGQGGLNFVAS